MCRACANRGTSRRLEARRDKGKSRGGPSSVAGDVQPVLHSAVPQESHPRSDGLCNRRRPRRRGLDLGTHLGSAGTAFSRKGGASSNASIFALIMRGNGVHSLVTHGRLADDASEAPAFGTGSHCPRNSKMACCPTVYRCGNSRQSVAPRSDAQSGFAPIWRAKPSIRAIPVPVPGREFWALIGNPLPL